MARKIFGFARATNLGGRVRLSWFMTTWFYSQEGRSLSEMRVQIYRSKEDGFVWGQDYGEYFDGLRPDDAELIFNGVLMAQNQRKFEYVDEDVELRATYVYWIASDRGETPTGPIPVRTVDHEVWWPVKEVEDRMSDLADERADIVQMALFGTTCRGKPIRGLVIGNPRRCIALVGTIHGGESGPELILPAAERLVREHSELLGKAGLAVLPTVNYESREAIVRGNAWYVRTNANGVDLNRNFDADWEKIEYGYGVMSSDPDSMTWRGPEANSERETKAVTGFLEHTGPRAVFAYHCLASITGACFLAPRAAGDDAAFGEQCLKFATPYTQGFLDTPNAVPQLVFGCSAGSLPTWTYRRLGVPGFDLEKGSEEPAEEAAVRDEATPEMLTDYQERHFRGIKAVLEMLAGAAKGG